MKNKALEQKWLNVLKEDLPPESLPAIERLWSTTEDFVELAEDYFICKQQIRLLEQTSSSDICHKYRSTLEELKTEIREFILRNEPRIKN